MGAVAPFLASKPLGQDWPKTNFNVFIGAALTTASEKKGTCCPA